MNGEGHLTGIIAQWLGGGTTAVLLAQVIMIAVTLLGFALCWWLVNRLAARLQAGIHASEGRWLKTLSIQRQRIFSQQDIVDMLHKAVTLLKWLLKLVLIVVFGNAVFSAFEWSRDASMQVFGFIGDTLGTVASAIIGYLPSLAIIIIVVLISRFVIHLLKLVFDGISRNRIKVPGFYPEWGHTSFNLARLLVIALTIIIIFPYLPGSGSPAFQGLSIFFGVLFSLGSTSAIANIIAGIVITYTRAFKIGDRVRIADTEGDVVERSAFVTRICTPKNVEVAIPNAMVMANHIINYSAQALNAGLLLHTTVTIGYDVPWPKVHELLLEAASRTDKLMEDPKPFVLQTSLDDNYVAYELNCYTHEASGKQKIYSEIHANIQDCFHAAGVEILSPHYRANRDGSAVAIPELGHGKTAG